jgi:hypothetical protein
MSWICHLRKRTDPDKKETSQDTWEVLSFMESEI